MMERVPDSMQYLLGRTPWEVTGVLDQLGISSEVIHTRDPKDKDDNVSERVIRIKRADNVLEILVGYFKDTSV